MAGEKRAQDKEEQLLNENVIIVDIEGTTTSISFVKDKLFPYIRDNVQKYVEAKWEDQEFKSDLEKLKEQAKKDEEDKIDGVVPISGSTVIEEKESLVKNVIWQMDGDRKTGALKQLQGHMWREAYDSGKIKGHVYEDVPDCLKSWKNAGKKIYVYSSGSVEAQKLLFGHSERGDLLEYFSGHFDTAVGMKQEAASYKNILNQIKAEATDVIFLTDIVKEAKAAKEAGLSSIVMIREGNAPLTAEDTVEFRTAKSFLDLAFLNPAKRQKLETPDESKEKPAAVEPAAEKMEVSEDVEMTDVSDKDSKSKVESNDTKADAGGSKDVGEETAPASETVAEKDEAMETDGKTVEAVKEIHDTKPAEEPKKETVENKKEETKSEETAKTVEKEAKAGEKVEEKVEKSNADETDKAILADSKKTEISEKPVEVLEKKTDPAKAEGNEVMEESPQTVTETKTAAKVADEKTETKTEGSDKQSEPSTNDKLENQTENTKSDMETQISKTKDVEKSEPKEGENLAGESEKLNKPKSDEAVKQSGESSVQKTVTENGTSKIDETSKTDTEVNEKSEKKDVSSEVKKTEEAVAVAAKEPSDKNSKEEETKTEAVVAEAKKEAEIKETDTVKSGEDKEVENKEGGKTETTEVSKDTTASAVGETVKKLNGTTQNGDSAKLDDNNTKIHSNGVNEPCTSDSANTKTNTEASQQNREPESSTDASAESIKVKKVVDSTVADGAGEPDVVTPAVAVAATS